MGVGHLGQLAAGMEGNLLRRSSRSGTAAFRSKHGIRNQHGDRHGAHAPGDGGDVGRIPSRAFEIHIAGQFAVGEPIDAHIKDGGTGLHHIARNEPRHPGGNDQYVGTRSERGQIDGLRMAHTYGRMARKQ